MFARVRLYLSNSSWCNGVGGGYRRGVLSPPLIEVAMWLCASQWSPENSKEAEVNTVKVFSVTGAYDIWMHSEVIISATQLKRLCVSVPFSCCPPGVLLMAKAESSAGAQSFATAVVAASS